MNTKMDEEVVALNEDLENRDREFDVLNSVIEYLANRDDVEDPSPGFMKQGKKDYGFVSDVIVLLCPLHPWMGRLLPDGDKLREGLSQYLVEKVGFPQDYRDYSQETCLNNVKAFRDEKRVQYRNRQRELEELTVKD